MTDAERIAQMREEVQRWDAQHYEERMAKVRAERKQRFAAMVGRRFRLDFSGSEYCDGDRFTVAFEATLLSGELDQGSLGIVGLFHWDNGVVTQGAEISEADIVEEIKS